MYGISRVGTSYFMLGLAGITSRFWFKLQWQGPIPYLHREHARVSTIASLSWLSIPLTCVALAAVCLIAERPALAAHQELGRRWQPERDELEHREQLGPQRRPRRERRRHHRWDRPASPSTPTSMSTRSRCPGAATRAIAPTATYTIRTPRRLHAQLDLRRQLHAVQRDHADRRPLQPNQHQHHRQRQRRHGGARSTGTVTHPSTARSSPRSPSARPAASSATGSLMSLRARPWRITRLR